MTLADPRSTHTGDATSDSADDSAAVILETFIKDDSHPVGVVLAGRSNIPFAYKAGASALFGLLTATGTVVTVPATDIDVAQVRYAGDWTSTQPVSASETLPWVPRPATDTRTGDATAAPAVAAEITGTAIVALYELSGLTYKQLAAVFGVSERSLHLWANGASKPVRRHLERLGSLLEAVRRLDAPDASSRRAALLHSPGGAPSIYSTWLRELSQGKALVGDVDGLHDPARHA